MNGWLLLCFGRNPTGNRVGIADRVASKTTGKKKKGDDEKSKSGQHPRHWRRHEIFQILSFIVLAAVRKSTNSNTSNFLFSIL